MGSTGGVPVEEGRGSDMGLMAELQRMMVTTVRLVTDAELQWNAATVSVRGGMLPRRSG